MNKKKLQQLMACLTILSSCSNSIDIHATEKKPIQRSNSAVLPLVKKASPFVVGTGMFGLAYLVKNKLSKSMNDLHNENLQIESKKINLEEAKKSNEKRKQILETSYNDTKSKFEKEKKKVSDFVSSNFDLSDVPPEKFDKLIENIAVLIPDSAVKAYNNGDLNAKKAIINTVAGIIEALNADKQKEAIEKMQALESYSDEEKNILGYVVKMLSMATDGLSMLDMAGIKAFGEDKTNEEGLKEYFKGVVDYLIPTEGNAEQLKLAKFIKKIIPIVSKHYGKEPSKEVLVKLIFGSGLEDSEFVTFLIEKLGKILEMPD